MRTRSLTIVLLGFFAATLSAQASGRSTTCGPINGKSQADLANVRTFCDKAIPKDLAVVGAYSMESLLWIKVNRELADAMLRDRLSSENIMRNWMKVWKQISGSAAVTIYVEWQQVEIAKGDTTLLSGDKITFKQ
jgi:hypothetical protein